MDDNADPYVWRHKTTELPDICFVVLIKVTGKIFLDPIFMPPTLKKLKGHIALGLSVCVHPSVCPCDHSQKTK